MWPKREDFSANYVALFVVTRYFSTTSGNSIESELACLIKKINQLNFV